MMNDYSSVETSGNEMGEGGESVPCVHIYAMPDGSYKLERTEAMAPSEGGQTAQGMEDLVEMLPGMFSGEQEEDDMAMQAARKGYASRAPKQMQAPGGVGAIFGE